MKPRREPLPASNRGWKKAVGVLCCVAGAIALVALLILIVRLTGPPMPLQTQRWVAACRFEQRWGHFPGQEATLQFFRVNGYYPAVGRTNGLGVVWLNDELQNQAEWERYRLMNVGLPWKPPELFLVNIGCGTNAVELEFGFRSDGVLIWRKRQDFDLCPKCRWPLKKTVLEGEMVNECTSCQEYFMYDEVTAKIVTGNRQSTGINP